MRSTAGPEHHVFQTEVQQLLDLMIHSLYSRRDVFLRELVSNASDAVDKRRFAGVTEPSLLPGGPFEIVLAVDAAGRRLSVRDNGIGMSRDEVVRHIGTIAHSGTGEFLEALEKARRAEAPPELIGQFGVGFYASFMVADEVELLTRRAGEERATRWRSKGDGGYDIEEAEREEAGTTVTLHLRAPDPDDGLEDYCDPFVLRRIVKRYSDFVAHPIRLEGVEEPGAPEGPLNSMSAIWTRSQEEVEDAERAEFYRHISHDWSDPLLHVATRIEGTFEARALLFVPSQAPFDLYHREAAHRGIQLYVKRVFIMDECRELMPEWLRFVKGVVDAEDLSLNVSREMLQQDRQIRAIRRHLVKKVLEALKELSEGDPEKYAHFHGHFGPVLREGLLARDEHTERILELVRVRSTHATGEDGKPATTSLVEACERAGEERDCLYYLAGPSLADLEASPHLEAFRERGIEVLFFTEPVDEVWLSQSPPLFRGKRFQSVGRGEVDLPAEAEGEATSEAREARQEAHGGLLARLRRILQDEVQEVRLSSRLTRSPACLVLPEDAPSPQMLAMLRQAGQELPAVKPILEINPEHALVAKLQALADQEPESPALERPARLLLGLAQLAEGARPEDPAALARLLEEWLTETL